MMNGDFHSGFGGITEHLCALAEPRLSLPRKIAVAGGGAAAILLFLILAARFPALLPLFLLLTAGASFLTWFLWRFADVEYEYLITQGEMSFSAVYGKRQRKDLFSFPLKEAEKILSYEQNRAACDTAKADETRFYAARYDDPDTFCALIRREDGKTVRLFFQGTPRALAAIRAANPQALKA